MVDSLVIVIESLSSWVCGGCEYGGVGFCMVWWVRTRHVVIHVVHVSSGRWAREVAIVRSRVDRHEKTSSSSSTSSTSTSKSSSWTRASVGGEVWTSSAGRPIASDGCVLDTARRRRRIDARAMGEDGARRWDGWRGASRCARARGWCSVGVSAVGEEDARSTAAARVDARARADDRERRRRRGRRWMGCDESASERRWRRRRARRRRWRR